MVSNIVITGLSKPNSLYAYLGTLYRALCVKSSFLAFAGNKLFKLMNYSTTLTFSTSEMPVSRKFVDPLTSFM